MMKKTIKGLEGRDPVGAILSIGKKAPTGFPTETDRFHIVSTTQNENKIRPPHPAFKSFNEAPVEKRKIIRGNLIHATRDECFEYYLTAQVLAGKKMHPNKRPSCTGNGTIAMRWMENPDDPNDYAEIKCPDKRCEYRQGDKPSCKPFARMLFRFRWPDGILFPELLAKTSTKGWDTCANYLGFFNYIEKVAKQLGIEKYSLFGYPFMLTLTRKTNATRRTSFPVVTITPEQDPIQFFTAQGNDLAKLEGLNALALPDMQSEKEISEDLDSLEVPRNENE